MKKFTFLLTLLFISVVAFAEGHLTFKGEEINGTLLEFTQKLQNKGYKKVYTNDTQDACMLLGAFAGFDDCQVAVLSTKVDHIVWKVAVYLPEQTSWYSLKQRYNDFKASLTEKYGTPSDDFHFFSSPYYEGDGYELQALKGDKCTYATYFTTETGYISVKIKSAGYGKGQILISYEDKENAALDQKAKKSSAMEDL